MSRISLCCSSFSFSVQGSQSKPEAADSSSSAVSLLWASPVSAFPGWNYMWGHQTPQLSHGFLGIQALLHILLKDCITTAPPPSPLDMLFQT